MSVNYEQYPLSRDYYKQPLEYGEKPPYEDVYKCMCEYCLPMDEIAILFNVIPSRINKWCKFYNISRTKEQKLKLREQTNIKKYGTSNVSKLPVFKEKVKQTSLKKYGVTNVNKLQTTRDKIKKTNLQRYGVENASQSEVIKQKTRDNCMKKYGVPSKNMLPEKIQKCKETNIEKYGNVCSLHGEEIKQKTIENNIKKFGVPWPMQNKEVLEKSKKTFLQHYGTTNISNSHLPKWVVEVLETRESFQAYIDTLYNPTIESIAKELGVNYTAIQKRLKYLDMWDSVIHFETQAELDLKQYLTGFVTTRSAIPPYEIDLYNEELKLGIEYNGVYWHTEEFRDKYYHQTKSKLAKDNGIFLYHIFENEWNDTRIHPIIISQINNLIGKNNKIGARKCTVTEITHKDSCMFLDNNHIQGQDKASIRLGLFYEDELVALMTFCKPRFNKNYEYELSRFCCKLNTTVIGGASKLFKYFIKTYTPKSIITYSDCCKTKGTLYPSLGFSFIRQTEPNYVWVNSTSTEILSRYQCQKHLLIEYNELGNTEVEIMHNRGYKRLWDCGNYVWEWKV